MEDLRSHQINRIVGVKSFFTGAGATDPAIEGDGKVARYRVLSSAMLCRD
jgi:hypothetical protein